MFSHDSLKLELLLIQLLTEATYYKTNLQLNIIVIIPQNCIITLHKQSYKYKSSLLRYNIYITVQITSHSPTLGN